MSIHFSCRVLSVLFCSKSCKNHSANPETPSLATVEKISISTTMLPSAPFIRFLYANTEVKLCIISNVVTIQLNLITFEIKF